MTLFDADPFPEDTNSADRGECRSTVGGVVTAGVQTVPTGSVDRVEVFTDGACQGNPGPGGWGWVLPNEMWASGAEDPSTNQRMELAAALHAVLHLEGPIEIVSDSTYVVNCFRDEWWKGWERRGWRNSQKKDVANQDLWKPLVAAYKVSDVNFRWVKGHAGNRWNDEADRLAVEAAAGRGTDGVIERP